MYKSNDMFACFWLFESYIESLFILTNDLLIAELIFLFKKILCLLSFPLEVDWISCLKPNPTTITIFSLLI